jgi:hypothetical protein
MMTDPLSAALQPVAQVLEKLGVLYYVGGSVASMAHGEYRQTADVDIVAHLLPEHVKPLVAALESEYYVDEAMIVDSLKYRRSFNVMHLDTMFKVDVFPLKGRPYDAEAAGRRQREVLEIQPPLEVYVASAEDILLAKLEWYRLGGGSSERQWRDILGICKMQFFDLDFEYLEKWSQEIKVGDLLERAFDEAGLKEAS